MGSKNPLIVLLGVLFIGIIGSGVEKATDRAKGKAKKVVAEKVLKKLPLQQIQPQQPCVGPYCPTPQQQPPIQSGEKIGSDSLETVDKTKLVKTAETDCTDRYCSTEASPIARDPITNAEIPFLQTVSNKPYDPAQLPITPAQLYDAKDIYSLALVAGTPAPQVQNAVHTTSPTPTSQASFRPQAASAYKSKGDNGWRLRVLYPGNNPIANQLMQQMETDTGLKDFANEYGYRPISTNEQDFVYWQRFDYPTNEVTLVLVDNENRVAARLTGNEIPSVPTEVYSKLTSAAEARKQKHARRARQVADNWRGSSNYWNPPETSWFPSNTNSDCPNCNRNQW